MNKQNSQQQEVEKQEEIQKAKKLENLKEIQYFSSDFDYPSYFELIKDQIRKDGTVFSDTQIQSIIQNSGKSWEIFYKKNKSNFFKDRKYLSIMFNRILSHLKPYKTQLSISDNQHDNKIILLELGCGAGNTIYPLLQLNQNLQIYACDISPSAIENVKKHPNYNRKRVFPFCYDLTYSYKSNQDLPSNTQTTQNQQEKISADFEKLKQGVKDSPELILNSHKVDICTSIFFLSALTPDQCKVVIRIMLRSLRPGGILYIRDYCVYDLSMRRFDKKKSRINVEQYLYVRGDGTLAQFFQKDKLVDMIRTISQEQEGQDVEIIESKIACVKGFNHKKKLDLHRVFINLIFKLKQK